MHLIAALASGVNGAESGTAYLYQRGTSTLLTSYYTDFEATASTPQTSTGIALDAHGGALVYVDTLCKVVVKSSTGSTIRTFVAGDKDSAVEVISDSFTGVDYEDASTGVNKPTTLQSVLNRWNDSAGTSDFKVMLGGVATNLQTAVQGLGGIFFNVKHSDYGAVGNGTTDDTASIQAAVDAADAAGGGVVVFPAGTYQITDEITVPETVSLMGVGAQGTHVRLDANTASGASAFVFSGSGTLYRWQLITGLRVSCAQSNSNDLLQITDAYVHVDRCVLIGSTSGFDGGIVIERSSASGFSIKVTNTEIRIATAGIGVAGLSSAVTGRIDISGCIMTHMNTSQSFGFVSAASAAGILMLSDTYFDASAATSSFANAQVESDGDMIVTGCYLKAPATGTGTFLDFGGIASSGGIGIESGNVVDGDGAVMYTTIGSSLLDQVQLHSRTLRWLDASTTDAAYTATPLQYGSERVQKTGGAAALAISQSGQMPPRGHFYSVTVWNDGTGGNVAVSWGTGFKGTGDNVANNTMKTYQFVSRAGPSGTVSLYQVGTPRDETE